MMSELSLIKASAGSGKTYTLTGNFIKMVIGKHPEYYRHILAVTFTNKATTEMKNRILEELSSLSADDSSGRLEELLQENASYSKTFLQSQSKKILNHILHGYSWFKVETIDSFFQSVIRSFLHEIGIPGNYSIELDQHKILNEAIDNFLDNLNSDNEILTWILEYLEQRINEGKSWNLKYELNRLGYQLFNEKFIRKSQELSRNFEKENFIVDYRNKLYAIKKKFEKSVFGQAKILMERIEKAGYSETDFYQGSRGPYSFIRKNSEELFTIPNKFATDVMEIPDKWPSGKSENKEIIISFVQKQLQIDYIKLVNYIQSDYENYLSAKLILKNFHLLGLLFKLQNEINNIKSNKGISLISDAAPFIYKIIDNNDIPFIYEKTGVQFNHLLIDEFQDTSEMQWANFKPLISNCLSGNHNCFIVGDVKQSIYRWRNSDWEIIAKKVYDDIPYNSIAEETIDTNWRSSAKIIEFNNAVFDKIHETIVPVIDNFDSDIISLDKVYNYVIQKLPPELPENKGYVYLKFFNSGEYHEMPEYYRNDLINRINEVLKNKYLPGDIAILVRKKEEGSLLANFLIEANKNAKFERPIGVISNESLFLIRSAAVKFVIAAMKYILNSGDKISGVEFLASWLHIVNNTDENIKLPSGNYSNDILKPVFGENLLHQLINLKTKGLYNIVESICNLFDLHEINDESIYLHSFLDVVYEYSNKEHSGLSGFLNFWEEEGATKTISAAETENAVKILTIHKSKGLQFPVVIIPFADWSFQPKPNDIMWVDTDKKPFDELPLIPINFTRDVSESCFRSDYYKEKYLSIVDNINLLYVALTRAKDVLVCLAKKSDNQIKSVGDILFTRINILPGNNSKLLKIVADNSYVCGEISTRIFKEKSSDLEYIGPYGKKNMFPEVKISSEAVKFLRKRNGINDAATQGRILHALMEKIKTENDIPNVLQSTVLNGIISKDELEIFSEKIKKSLKNQVIKEWFSGKYKVITEVDILGGTGNIKRPDRVMIKKDEVIIIDYKFGKEDIKEHTKQIINYIDLIKKMGYNNVQGYLWYLFEEDLVEVKL